MNSKQIGQMIQRHRKASGLSQKELAHMAEIGKTAVFDSEHGKPTIQMDTLLKILRVLNIQLSFTSPLSPESLQEKK